MQALPLEGQMSLRVDSKELLVGFSCDFMSAETQEVSQGIMEVAIPPETQQEDAWWRFAGRCSREPIGKIWFGR